MSVFPAPLIPPNSTIALISPASAVTKAEIAPGRHWLESLGYSVVEPTTLYEKERFCAGSDQSRAEEFMAAWCDASIDAIITVRGGYGSQRILPLLDWDCIAQHQKPFIGFSDTTALQLGLLAKADISSFSGFTLVGDTGVTHTAIEQAFRGDYYHERPLVGGCLSLITALVGTQWFPSLENRWLIIEEVGEQPYAVDRMLSSLELAGCFTACAGVMLGSFYNCISKDEADGTIDEVLHEWEKRLPCPVERNRAYGHGPFSPEKPRSIVQFR